MLTINKTLSIVGDTQAEADKVQDIKDLVHSVMERLDGWRDEHREEVEFLPLTLGMTNQLFCIKTSQEDCVHKAVVVRIYGEGTGDLIDRENELWVQSEIGSLGLSAKVLARFDNGLILEHLPGGSLDPFLVRDPKTSEAIAQALARLHKNLGSRRCSDSGGKPKSAFWNTVNKWIAKIETKNPNMLHEIVLEEEKKDDDGDEVESSESAVVTPETLRSLMEEIKSFVDAKNLPVAFCHNDLNSENIIQNNDDIFVIDFEYADFNFRAFDLGNHFCEWAGVATNLNFAECYPDKQSQERFLRSYLLETQEGKYLEKDLEDIMEEARIGTLLSHFFWAIWGFTQDSISTLAYDYIDYATVRMKHFLKMWSSFPSSLPLSSSL